MSADRGPLRHGISFDNLPELDPLQNCSPVATNNGRSQRCQRFSWRTKPQFLTLVHYEKGNYAPAFASARGGVRSGVDVAKAIALGADLGATAKPALGPANAGEGAQGVIEELRAYIDELRIAMFCSGCADVQALRALKLVRAG